MFGKKKGKEKKEPPKKPTTWYGKIWYFIWHDNSVASWIVNIILAYLIIKFIVYPLLGLIFGTGFPIVAVVSNSMEHRTSYLCLTYDSSGACTMYDYSKNEICGKNFDTKQSLSFDEFWETCQDHYLERNITKEEFENYPLKNGFNRGDIMYLIGKKPEDIKIGDVIVFQSKKPYPIIHRVVSKDDKGMWVFQTLGDHNKAQIRDSELDESQVLQKQLLGKAVLRVPWLGYVKIWFVDLMKMTGLYYVFSPG